MTNDSIYNTGTSHLVIRQQDMTIERKKTRLLIGFSSSLFCMSALCFLSSLFSRHITKESSDLPVSSLLSIVGSVLMMLASVVFCVGMRRRVNLESNERSIF